MVERKRMGTHIIFNLSNSLCSCYGFSLGNALPNEHGLTFIVVTKDWGFFLDIYFLKYALWDFILVFPLQLIN